MRAQQFIPEIDRIAASDYRGGKNYLGTGGSGVKRFRKLPGGSGFLYTIQEAGHEPWIKLWDPRGAEARPGQPQIIGRLTLEQLYGFPLAKALQVGTITVSEDYRGQGLAKALYGIVLSIMKRPLVAGDSQTPGGRRNWVSLSQIPGVEMKGYVGIGDDDLDYRAAGWGGSRGDVEKNIDTIMGKLGGQYMGASPRGGNHYFSFDVRPTTTGRELEAYVKTNLSKVYGSNYSTVTGLYAVWTGK